MRRKEFRQEPWSRRAAVRRSLFLLLIVVPTFITSGYMAGILPHKGSTPLELAIVIVFAALFAWISIGFWTALLGFYTLVRRVDRFAITQSELD
ncbi:MAG TPA: glucan biosynthesis glucosyltransferase H, partial [Gammaproteobacteria bacterium]|nr:glucan biosynthesis glucosyltransferase H [Gammaproteobacteria bacterium]